MLSFHSTEDIHLIKKGSTPDGGRWIELELVTREGIMGMTIYFQEDSNLNKKVMRLLELITDDAATRPEDTPFEVTLATTPMPRILDPFAPLIREYAMWDEKQGFKESLGAEERLFDERLSDTQRAWLSDFINRWDAVQESAGAKA